MNITRRDTIIIATIFNLLVFVTIIVTGKMGGASNKNQLPSDQVMVATNNPLHSDLSYIEKRNEGKAPISDSGIESPGNNRARTLDLRSDTSLKPNDELFSYDEIDQLLEEYALSHDSEDSEVRSAADDKVVKPKVVADKKIKASPSIAVDTSKKEGLNRPSQASTKKPQEVSTSAEATKKPLQKPLSGKKDIGRTSKPVQPNSSVYIVQPGDNPWTIAKKCKISFERLLELNNLDEAKAKNLKIGQALKIKDDSSDDD